MSKFLANCVVMGVKSKPSQDGTRTYRTAMLYFDDDTTSLEASISDEHEHLYRLMEANKMKPCHLMVNLRAYKGQRFIDVLGYSPTGAVALPSASK